LIVKNMYLKTCCREMGGDEFIDTMHVFSLVILGIVDIHPVEMRLVAWWLFGISNLGGWFRGCFVGDTSRSFGYYALVGGVEFGVGPGWLPAVLA
jgi:hypothetical protein